MSALDNFVVQNDKYLSGKDVLYNLIEMVGIADILSAMKDYCKSRSNDVVWNTDEADICYADGKIFIFKK